MSGWAYFSSFDEMIVADPGLPLSIVLIKVSKSQAAAYKHGLINHAANCFDILLNCRIQLVLGHVHPWS